MQRLFVRQVGKPDEIGNFQLLGAGIAISGVGSAFMGAIIVSIMCAILGSIVDED